MKKMADNQDDSLRPVLDRLFFTASLHFIDKHSMVFYQGGLFVGEQPLNVVRQTLLDLCGELKREAIGLIDSIAPPDFVLNTPLGISTGEVYKASYSAMIQSNGSFDVIGDLEHFMNKTKFGCLKSKI